MTKLAPSGTTLILFGVSPGGGGVTKSVGQSQVRSPLFPDYPVELVRMILGIKNHLAGGEAALRGDAFPAQHRRPRTLHVRE